MSSALTGRVALVTGVSRPVGIAATVARRLHDMGATVFATGYSPHDAEMPWGVEPLGDMPFDVRSHDLELAATPAALIDEVIDAHGALDIVAAVHARSGAGRGLDTVTADDLDRCWAANVRSTVLLAQRFAAVHAPLDGDAPTGRMLWFTSGQHLEPMEGEIDYAISKGALHQLTTSMGRALAPSQIIANCINPGPVDTGYATGDVHAKVAAMFPDGRWGTPVDVANLVAFLVSDEGAWIRGQVINSEGGFDRTR